MQFFKNRIVDFGVLYLSSLQLYEPIIFTLYLYYIQAIFWRVLINPAKTFCYTKKN